MNTLRVKMASGSPNAVSFHDSQCLVPANCQETVFTLFSAFKFLFNVEVCLSA